MSVLIACLAELSGAAWSGDTKRETSGNLHSSAFSPQGHQYAATIASPGRLSTKCWCPAAGICSHSASRALLTPYAARTAECEDLVPKSGGTSVHSQAQEEITKVEPCEMAAGLMRAFP